MFWGLDLGSPRGRFFGVSDGLVDGDEALFDDSSPQEVEGKCHCQRH